MTHTFSTIAISKIVLIEAIEIDMRPFNLDGLTHKRDLQ